MCVSTGKVGSLKATAMTTLAVLCPTPASCSNSGRVFGTSPLCLSTRACKSAHSMSNTCRKQCRAQSCVFASHEVVTWLVCYNAFKLPFCYLNGMEETLHIIVIFVSASHKDRLQRVEQRRCIKGRTLLILEMFLAF